MANPVPIPYQTPIANLPKAGGQITRGKGGRSPGGPERPHTDPHANFCTQPWLKWFRYVDELAGATSNLDILGVVGQDISGPSAVYLSVGAPNDPGKTAGRWYPTDRNTDVSAVQTIRILGFVLGTVVASATVPIRIMGTVTGLTGITPGALYSTSDTPGVIVTNDYPIGPIIAVGETATSVVMCQSWNNTYTMTSIDFAQDTLLPNTGAPAEDFVNTLFPTYAAATLYPPGPIEHIECNFSFRLVANANTKTIRVRSQGNVLIAFTTADPAITQVVGYGNFWPNVNGGTLRYNIVLIGSGAGANVIRIADDDVLVNNTDLDIQPTVQSTANSDVTQSLFSSVSYAYL
jgi:hypothetical protein